MDDVARKYRYESWDVRQERIQRECQDADGRVELVYDSQNARSAVSVRGRTVEPKDEYELVRVSTSQRESDLVVDHNHSVRTAVPHDQAEGRGWKHHMGGAIAVKNLTEQEHP